MADVHESVVGGRGGIRTHGTLAGTPVFKTGALNHSATLPNANLMREGVPDCKRRLGARVHAGGRPAGATIPSPRPCPPHFRRVRPAIYSYLGAEMGRIGKSGRSTPEIGTRPAEWYLGRMGIRRSNQVGRAVRAAAVAGACLMLANCAQHGKFSR